MDGRVQNELMLEKKNDRKVSRMPSFVNSWYLNMKASRKTATTCRDFLNKINRFLEYINHNVSEVKISDINESNVTEYYLSIQTKTTDNRKVFTSDSYQVTVWYCLDNFLEYLYKAGKIERNYIRNIDKPKNHDLERINEHRVLLTSENFKSILSAVDEEKDEVIRKRDKALILLFMNTGIRCTAMSTIMLDDIDFKKSIFRVVDKGNKHHEYVLNKEVMYVIKAWLNERSKYISDKHDNGYLFISERGNKMHNDTITYAVKKYTQRALGKPLSPHKLRAGYCSILYNKTGDIEFVRRAVGHSYASTTQRYIVTKGEEKRRAAEIMGSIL